ncbi:MAG TPA: PQQ-binding-like beta-propeller repeat protein [Acetobacteraceae bacterium]|nr:PQQ-binding-like beta-propeller repeat protein [Acetobacteraceae bacterium]
MKPSLKLGRRVAMLAPLALLAGCGDFLATPKKYIPGDKVPVLPVQNPLLPDANAPAVSLPAPANLIDWPQASAGPTHMCGNIAAGADFNPAVLKPAWRTDIGAGGDYRRPLRAQPVVANGTVFTMDANGVVSAYTLADGKHLWRLNTRPKHNNAFDLGGGLGFDSGVLYASTGFGELIAITPASGTIIWRKPLGYPARSAPSIGGGQVYVLTLDDSLLALDAKTGDQNWKLDGGAAENSMLGAGAPAFSNNIVVAGFASGLLAGVDAANGTPLWEQSLAASFGAAGPLEFSSIAAAPVIIDGLVVATGLGGSTVAYDLRSGRQIWSHSAAGTQTPAAAGDWIFTLTNDQTLAAIHAPDGLIGWVSVLPRFKNPKDNYGPITWSGPLLIGGVLMMTGSNERALFVNPLDGALVGTLKTLPHLDGLADLPPIAADGTILVLTRNAKLSAYR